MIRSSHSHPLSGVPVVEIRPEEQDAGSIYSLMIRAITPRPIAWVSTQSPAGVTNLAPFSYFNGVGSVPPALMFSVVNHPDGRKKDTLRNIESLGQFVVNVVPASLAEPMQATAAGLAYEVSEFETAGILSIASKRVRPPGVAQSPVRFECETMQVVEVGQGPLAANVVIGKILMIVVDDRVLDERGKMDPAKLDTIGRMGGKAYCHTRDRFEIGDGRPK